MEPGVLASGVCHQSTVDPGAWQWQIKPPLIAKRGVFLLFNSHKNNFSTERFISIIVALIIRQNAVFTDLKFCFLTDAQIRCAASAIFFCDSLKGNKVKGFLVTSAVKRCQRGRGISQSLCKKRPIKQNLTNNLAKRKGSESLLVMWRGKIFRLGLKETCLQFSGIAQSISELHM